MNVSTPETFAEYNRKIITVPSNLPLELGFQEYHKLVGWSLGYPECCTAEYVRPRTVEEQRASQHHLTHRFGKQLEDKIKIEGSYPDFFDCLPPAFTPCKIDCPEASSLLQLWQDALLTLDSEAGESVRFFNRYNYPNSLVHQKYLQEKLAEFKTEYVLDQLRISI